MKTCKKCGASKPESEFPVVTTSKAYVTNTCKECKREYSRNRYRSMTAEQRKNYNEAKREWYAGEGRASTGKRQRREYSSFKKTIRDYKSSFGCLRCGEKDPYALDFHHIAEKLTNISMSHKSVNSVALKEISKCIVLCANCHRKLHAGSWNLADISIPMMSVFPEAYGIWIKGTVPPSH